MKERTDTDSGDDNPDEDSEDSDADIDTGLKFGDFHKGDSVVAYWKGGWYNATVTELDITFKALNLRFTGQAHKHPPADKVCRKRHTAEGYKPRCVRKR